MSGDRVHLPNLRITVPRVRTSESMRDLDTGRADSFHYLYTLEWQRNCGSSEVNAIEDDRIRASAVINHFIETTLTPCSSLKKKLNR